MSSINLNGQTPSSAPVVILTGGTQGLGLALTRVLLNDGFAVSICARTEADVNAVRGFLTTGRTDSQVDGRLLSFTGDVANRDFQRAFIEETAAAFGRIDALVNNASTLGTLPMPQVVNSTLENDVHVFEVNVFAPLQLIRHVIPHFAKRPRSLILGMSSDAAVGGYPGWGIYGASKAALDLFHKTLAGELADQSVHVHSVDPGDMDTAMHHAADPGAEGLVNPLVVAQALLPSFQPLTTGSDFPFANGARLQVMGNGLTEVSA